MAGISNNVVLLPLAVRNPMVEDLDGNGYALLDLNQVETDAILGGVTTEQIETLDGPGLDVINGEMQVNPDVFEGQIDGLTNPLVEDLDADGRNLNNVGTASAQALEADQLSGAIIISDIDDLNDIPNNSSCYITQSIGSTLLDEIDFDERNIGDRVAFFGGQFSNSGGRISISNAENVRFIGTEFRCSTSAEALRIESSCQGVTLSGCEFDRSEGFGSTRAIRVSGSQIGLSGCSVDYSGDGSSSISVRPEASDLTLTGNRVERGISIDGNADNIETAANVVF